MALIVSACAKTEVVTPEKMVEAAKAEVNLISAEKANDIINGEEIYNLIDVRGPMEHYYGYIPGSVMIPRGSLEFSIGSKEFWEHEGLYEPQKDEIFILYCKKGNRSILAAQTLQRLGYTKVYVIDGGWKKWELTYPEYTEKDLDKLGGGNKHEEVGGC